MQVGKDKNDAILLTQEKDGTIYQRNISNDEIDQIFFQDHTQNWNQIQMLLPSPAWEKIYDDDGHLIYEGYTLNHKAFGVGRAYNEDGILRLEGIFGIKGLLSGRAYYPNGVIRFEGILKANQGYGPNFPEYGAWYDETGKELYRGEFGVSRSSLGWPRIYKPEGFGSVPDASPGKGLTFSFDEAKQLLKRSAE